MENEPLINHSTATDGKPPVVGSASLTEGQIAHQIEMDDEEEEPR